MSRAWGSVAIALALALGACQTAPRAVLFTPLAADDPRAAERLAWLERHAAARRSLRAQARVSLSGGAGSSFSKQLLLAEREAKLRIEVIGVLGQRALVLASDGVHYDLYRGETGKTETGVVDAPVLWRVARIPLLPSEAVGLLMAAPTPAGGPPAALVGPAGELRLVWPDRSVDFDATGQLAAARVLAGDGAEPLAVAHFHAWGGDGEAAFPQRVELEFPYQRGAALIEFRDVEVNPPLDPSWFRLVPAPVSSAAGETRP